MKDKPYGYHSRDEIDRSRLTLDIMKQVANSVCGFLKSTGKASTGVGPIACLESQLWVGQPTKDGPWFQYEGAPGDQNTAQVKYTILYKFYKTKPWQQY